MAHPVVLADGVALHQRDDHEAPAVAQRPDLQGRPGQGGQLLRAVRRDLMNELKEMLKEKLISEDDDRRVQDEIQKLTDRHVHDIDQVLAEKEKELLQV